MRSRAFFFVSGCHRDRSAIVIVEARARREATLPAMKERFYPKRVVGGRGTDARRYSGAEAGTAGRKPFSSVIRTPRGKDGLVDDIEELKQRVRRAQGVRRQGGEVWRSSGWRRSSSSQALRMV